MTSSCIFKDTFRKDTRVFLKFKISIIEICLHLINSSYTPYFLTTSTLSRNEGTSKEIPPDEKCFSLPAIPMTFSVQYFSFSCCDKKIFIHFSIEKSKMASNISLDSTDSDVFFVEQTSNQPNPRRNNSRIICFRRSYRIHIQER